MAPAICRVRNHQGRSGWGIDQHTESIGTPLLQWSPDIVLLLIGTKDVAQDYALDAAPGRLGALLDRILQAHLARENRVIPVTT